MDPDIKAALLNQFNQVNGNAKTFSQMLQDRRNFVQSSENGLADQAQGAVNNGSNGIALSPAAMMTPVLDYHTNNANQTAALTQQAMGYGSQASDLLKAIADLSLQAQGQNRENQSLEIQKYQNGLPSAFDKAGSSTGSGNARVDSWVNDIMQGRSTPDNVPATLKPMVLQELGKQGFDPAKDINGDLDSLKDLYGLHAGSPLSGGNNLGQTAHNDLGNLLNLVSGGRIQTPTEQKIQQYSSAVKDFQSKYGNVLGKSVSLPKVSDTPDTALQKFNAINEAIKNKFYQGGNRPTPQQRPDLSQIIK